MSHEQAPLCLICTEIFQVIHSGWCSLLFEGSIDRLSPNACLICANVCSLIRRHPHGSSLRGISYCYSTRTVANATAAPYQAPCLLIEVVVDQRADAKEIVFSLVPRYSRNETNEQALDA
jgi:hypothetical protein